MGHWWQNLLHNQTALRLKARLLFEPSVDGDERAMGDSDSRAMTASEKISYMRADDLLADPVRRPARSAGRTQPPAAAGRGDASRWLACRC